jgi:ATP-binding cassette subfamily B protein
MDYTLKAARGDDSSQTFGSAARTLAPLLADQKRNIVIALTCVVVSTASNLLSPALIARVVDTAIAHHDYSQLLRYAGLLAAVYVAALGTSYLQMLCMGSVGRMTLFKLRNALFTKLSHLPIAFFAQNKVGDLISRVNNDTDKINQFFAQALMQFFSAFFVIIGSGVVLLTLNWRLGAVALIPALAMLVITRAISPWIKAKSRKSLESLGGLSGEIQEGLANFKIIVAFNRVDYFRDKFDEANQRNFKASILAGISSSLFTPLYTLAGSAAQILVLGYGVWLIGHGALSIGLLIGYLLYVTAFYNPLRQLATVWSSLQQAMAALDRVSEVMALENDMVEMAEPMPGHAGALLAFNDVSFSYPNGKSVLEHVSLTLERGKTYALVGPTGGGKTTTAMLMARLYDPTSGAVYLDGRDIRSCTAEERASKIGFILQEPFLFSGTVRDNIAYGHDDLAGLSDEALMEKLADTGLAGFLDRFNEGLATPASATGDALSLGQKQLIAFMRAVLRQPEILILDEATANIDTVTEQLLEAVLDRLPAATTKVIIAHRLNTIQNADDIFFVGGGGLTEAGSMEDALDMLLNAKRVS